MNADALQRLFGFRDAFEHPLARWVPLAVAAAIAVTFLLTALLAAGGRISPGLRDEMVKRTRSWCVLVPLMFGPILLGAGWVMLGVLVLSILCYREFARSTGLFRAPLTSACVVLGIGMVMFAVLDHWYGFFVALPALGVITIAAVPILRDRPDGYIQRVALGGFAFLLFGVCLGHLGYVANDADFRPLLILLLVAVEMNDVFAFMSGRLFGERKIFPRTSPNKTLAGAVGALVLTTGLVVLMGRLAFAGTPMDDTLRLVGLGVVLSLSGQLGDLMLSSIKRDLGIKDMGATIPGHGGFLDRFDSLILTAPAFFHYVGYFNGIGLDQVPRIITGGG